MNSSELRTCCKTYRLYLSVCLRDYKRLLRENDMHIQSYSEHVDTGGKVISPVEDYNFRLEYLRDKIKELWVCIRTADLLINEYEEITDENIHECRLRAITDVKYLTI